MRKNLLWLMAALLMTACGGCSSDDQAGGSDEEIEADSLVVGDKLPEFEVTMNDGSGSHSTMTNQHLTIKQL